MTDELPPIARAARWYIERHGLKLVRLPPGSKGPRHEGWNSPGGWFATGDQAAEFYVGHADWGIGCVLGPSRLCSLDIDDLAAARVALGEFGVDIDALATAAPTVQGHPERMRILFASPPGLVLARHSLTWPRRDDPAKRLTVFELRAGDCQDVLPPSIHPTTGQPYRWITRPTDAAFPEVPPELLAVWLNWGIFRPQAEALCPWAAPVAPREPSAPQPPRIGASVIDAWNDAADLPTALERYGYQRRGKRYLSPHSGTGLPGVVLHPDGQHCWIHHASDPLCTDTSGARVDSFDLLCHYEHAGDVRAAVRAAGRALGLDRKRHHVSSAPVPDVGAVIPAVAEDAHDAQAAPVGVPILVELDESGPLLPMPQIIRGVLPADAVGMIWGPPGSYKSFVTLDWALSVSSDMDWLGHPVRGGTVWYLAGEGQSGLRHRVQAWRQARGYTGPLRFLHSTRAILLDGDDGPSAGLISLLRMIAAGRAPDLIVVDTLSRSMSGDESATRDASRYVAALDDLVAAVRGSGRRCTVVLVHHSRKDGDVYRGSSVLRGAADFEFEVESTASLSVRVTCRKVKDGSPPATFFLRLEPEQLGVATDDFGIDVSMSSLAVWMDRAPSEQEKADEKATALLKHIRAALSGYPDGLSQAALVVRLRDAGARFDKTLLAGFVALLAERGELVVTYGPRGSKRVRLPPLDPAAAADFEAAP